VDALRDLDDALSMVHLFAQVASSKLVPPTRVQACARLANEFQAYVARTRSLRKVFVSIKGFYYQAEVQGVSLTWVVRCARFCTFSSQPLFAPPPSILPCVLVPCLAVGVLRSSHV
jgi:hypothetical protein